MAENDLHILGINAYDHDVSACLLRNGKIVAAISKERLTRYKHDTGFYGEVVDYCLDAAGIKLDYVALIVRNCYVMPVRRIEQRLAYRDWPTYLDAGERAIAARHPLFRADSDRVVDVSHHLAHAYSAFAVSPFEDGVVMVVDGVGSYRADVTEPVPAGNDAHPLARESESYYRFAGSTIEPLKKVWMGPSAGFLSDEFFAMPGLGALYSRVSSYVFGDWNKCGEVMGLAPYGRPDRFAPLMTLDNGELRVPDWDVALNHPWLGNRAGWERDPARAEWEDLCWQVQEDTERVLLARAQWLHEVTGAKNLCIAGGVGLNCVANGKIAREGPFDNVWIQPAAGDDGIAIGCAYYGYLALRGQPRGPAMNHSYLGRAYDRPAEDAAFKSWSIPIETRSERKMDIAAATAERLASGEVVGWFQGRSEFGPRSLGNRSILADPRDPGMKDRLNARVKHRQDFRPFAPAVLAERSHEVFEGDGESPFMLLAQTVRPEWRQRVPAIVHVDGTARVQTVRREDNPQFHALLESFAARTGVPVLLNTSFNIRGEPIVETPSDAMACFLGTGIDVLVIHDWLVEKRASHRFVRPIVRYVERVRRYMREHG